MGSDKEGAEWQGWALLGRLEGDRGAGEGAVMRRWQEAHLSKCRL